MSKVSKKDIESIETDRDKLWIESIAMYLPNAADYDGIDELIAALVDSVKAQTDTSEKPIFGSKVLNI